MKILVINGPNLNLTGIRSPDIYGTDTLSSIIAELDAYVESCNSELFSVQTNHEGEIIDIIQSAMGEIDGMIINAGAFTHYSYAIRDAIEASEIPTVEVHLSDINSREDFRKVSVIKDVCIAQIFGLGKQGYINSAKLLLTREMN